MSNSVIKIENLSKQYRLGTVGSQTLRGDLQRLWWKIRGKGDPFARIGQENKLENVDGEYVWALKNINLEISEGEVVGIIGKNGAGKSTLLKIISRITSPTTGSIKIRGRIASLLEVGTGFHPELTGRENIFLNGAILGMTKAEINRKFDDIVDFAGIAKYIDTPVKRYSSGMYVRLGFAVAAHLDPEILIVDEVLAVGDAEFQKKAIGKMQDISKGQGRTVLFVSHNMATIKSLCSRSVLLKQGSVEIDDNTQKVISYYLNSGQTNSEFGKIPKDFFHNIWIKDKAFIKSIVLKNSENILTNNIRLLEPLIFEIEIDVFEEINDAIIVVRIGTIYLENITYSASDDLRDENYVCLKKGSHKIISHVQQNLMPGTYNVSISVFDKNGYPYDGIANFGSFTVENFGIENIKYRWTNTKGTIINKAEFEIV